MAFEKRDLSGALFTNKDRKTDNHPNMNGYVMVEGKEYWLSGWTKDGEKGRWISLALKPKEEQPQQKRQERTSYDEPDKGGASAYLDDDIPFLPDRH